MKAALIGSRRALAVRSSDVRSLLRYAKDPAMVSLAGGLPSPELFDIEGIAQATEHALKQSPVECLQYGMTEGQAALRHALVGLLEKRGIHATVDSIVVTTGSQQALDLIARALLDEGDTVVVERPTYLAALQALSLAGATYACIDVDDEGGQVEQLLALAPDPRIKLVYVVSTFSNPSGTTMSRARREVLVRWAMKHQVVILEDDPYGELRAAGERVESIYSIAASIPGASDWVCYTSTLSKIIAPGLRVGWLVMPPALVELVARIKQAMDLHSSSFAQQVGAAYLESGRLPGHIERVRTEYGKRQVTMRGLLEEAFGSKLKLRHSEGGMFLWGEFTDGTNTRDLLQHALEQGVMFVPGDVFYAADPQGNAIRLNFTSASVERLELGVARLQQAHRLFASLTKAAA